MTWVIAEAQSEADLAACLALRAEVFCGEQGISEADEQDGRDSEARHLLARVQGIPAATLRIRTVDDAAVIERVCVIRAQRGSGLGAALTRAALELAATMPEARRAKLGAQIQVIPFYERLGFAVHGPEYLDAGIPHRDMSRPLP